MSPKLQRRKIEKIALNIKRRKLAGLQHGDILTTREANYIVELEHLWDMVSDAVEGGRLTEADIPDDYKAFVWQMGKLVTIEGADDPELE